MVVVNQAGAGDADPGINEPVSDRDVAEGGIIGAVGGAVIGAVAGGPIGAVVGAVIGGAASAAGVDVVDQHDGDYVEKSETELADLDRRVASSVHDTYTGADYSKA